MPPQRRARPFASYEDFSIFPDDYRSIAVGWLTDVAVNFCATYVRNNIFGDDASKPTIIYSFTCEMIKTCLRREVSNCLTEAGADPQKFCFFILNDNTDPGQVYGGAHWALMVFDPTKSRIWQLDSMGDRKAAFCSSFASKVRQFFHSDYKVFKAPRMVHSGICGLYVVETMRYIKAGHTDLTTMSFSRVDDNYCMERRLVYTTALDNMAEEEANRQ